MKNNDMSSALIILLLFFSSFSYAADEQQLLTESLRVLEKEKAKLKDLRIKEVAERKIIMEKVHQAYRELAQAEEKRKSAQESLGELKRNRQEYQRNESSFKLKYNYLRQELISAGWTEYSEEPTPEFIANQITKKIRDRVNILDYARRIHNRKQAVITRSGKSEILPVLHIGTVQSFACGGDNETCGILKKLSDDHFRISGATLMPTLADELALSAAGKNTRLPVDVSSSLVSRDSAVDKSWNDWLRAGGLFVYPIIVCGVIGLVLIVERFIYLMKTTRSSADLSALLSYVNNRSETVLERRQKKLPEWRVLQVAIACCRKSESEREASMESALLSEVPSLNRSLSLLSALAGVAPLLGLLGTVSGMIHTFSDLAAMGADHSKVLSGGISEALITTQLGLMVAVPLLLFHAWLNRSVERREVLLEQWGMDMLHLTANEEVSVGDF